MNENFEILMAELWESWKLNFSYQNQENHEILTIPHQNVEHHANSSVALQNYENNEIYTILRKNQ